jgi:hypothetical protein
MLTLFATLVLAQAPAPADAVDVRAAMHEYYEGEFRGGFAWSTSGALSVAAAVPMFLSGAPSLRGAAWPTGLFWLAQVALGVASFFTAPSRIRRFDEQLTTSPSSFLETERPRLKTVASAFTVFQLTELAIVAAGTGLAGAGFARRDDTFVGVGLGLVVQSLLFLVLDELASTRADRYLGVLERQ